MKALAVLLILQSLSSWARAQEPQVSTLTIVALEGEGAFNNIKRSKAQRIVVEVRDANAQPVPEADVEISLPYSGPGGTFPGGKRTWSGKTDSSGRLSAEEFQPNSIEGRFNIRVSASAGQRRGAAVLAQSNTKAGGLAARESGGHKKLILLGLIGGGVTGAILATTAGGGSSNPAAVGPPPVSLSTGTIAVGGPR